MNLRPSTYKSARVIINHWILQNTDPHQLAQAIRRPDLQSIIKIMSQQCSRVHTARAGFILSESCKYGMELGCMKADYAHNIVPHNKKEPFKRKPSVSA